MSFFRAHPRLAAAELAAVLAFGVLFSLADASAVATIAAGVALLVGLCFAMVPAIVSSHPHSRERAESTQRGRAVGA